MSNFLKATAFLLGILCMSNSSCNKNEIDGIKTSPFGIPVELQVNDKVILPEKDKEILITLNSLSDSRCAKDVQCVWAGNAVAQVQINSADGTQKEVNLCIGQCDKQFKKTDTVTVSFINQTYFIILNEVKTDGTGKALITVSRK